MRRVLAALYQLPDGVYGTVSGILRGLGRQPQLLWVNLTGFWAVGMVTAVALTFPLGLGELGLWWGVLSGITATGALIPSSVMILLFPDPMKNCPCAYVRLGRPAQQTPQQLLSYLCSKRYV